MMHWNLPPTMAEKLAELNVKFNTVEAQTGKKNYNLLLIHKISLLTESFIAIRNHQTLRIVRIFFYRLILDRLVNHGLFSLP